jgi:transformation/transcription domain-associated protein
MSYIEHLDAFVTKLDDKSLNYEAKHSIFSELCDTLETYNGVNEYEYFLKKLLDVFFDNLKTVPISFVSNSNEQKLRFLILDIIHRLPYNETFQPYAITVSDNLMEILKSDNEENGLQCMKIITSLHKAYKNYMSSKVEEYMTFLKIIYENLAELVDEQFGTHTEDLMDDKTNNDEPKAIENSDVSENKKISTESSDMIDENNTNNTTNDNEIFDKSDGSSPSDFTSADEANVVSTLFKATHSFKMAAECPITLVSLYSTYKTLLDSTVETILPLVINVLKLQTSAQRKEHEKAKLNNTNVVKMAPSLRNNPIYNDFNFAQVKASSFMAYVFIRKSSSSNIEEYQKDIPDLIIRLLQDCPRELSTARRELLHATRHVLSTNLRTLFLPKMDLLFDDNILIGDGLTAHETLRPLAYSIVADFIHVNNSLTAEQIWKSVKTYSGYLQDNTLAQTVHIMSAKLLLNLMDRILKLENKTDSRQMLLLIIDTFGKRFAALNYQYQNIMNQHEEFKKSRKDRALRLKELETLGKELTGRSIDENHHIRNLSEKLHLDDGNTDNKMDVDKENDLVTNLSFEEIERNLPIQIAQPPTQDPLDSARYLFRTLMTFLKSICYGFKSCNMPPPKDYTQQVWQESTRIISIEELNIFKRLFRESTGNLKFFQSSKITTITSALKQSFEVTGPNLPITSSKEEKDLMEILATIFIYLEPAAFNEIMQTELPLVFDSTLDNPALLHIPQFFLASEITTSNFSSILIVFVISKLEELGDMDIVKSNILIRLFKLCFMSVNLFPTVNENVILPHLNKLILDCLKYSMNTKEPIVYFYLIRTLFRSIGGGRFESLYKEILPLLQLLLESLNRLVQAARRPHERDIYVELCLTVPVRLSVLVPYLSYLMKPLVFALNGSQDLISQGLRTLELCVDNLTAEYFDPIIEPVIEDVMKALWKHLKPLPYYHQHSHTTLRILGKLGGRNRNFMKLHNDLSGEVLSDQKLEGLFKIQGIEGNVSVSVTAAMNTAFTTLESIRYKLHYRVSAFKYLITILKLMVNADDIPNNYEFKVQQVIDFIIQEGKDPMDHNKISLEIDNTTDATKFDRQEELLVRLLKSLFFAVSLDETKDESYILIEGICQHYVLLSLSKAMIDHHKLSRQFSIANHEGKHFLNTNTIYEVISYALSHYISSVRDAGKFAVKIIFDTCVILFGSVNNALKFMPVRRMCSAFIHNCFEDAYYDKLGGCIGLQIMIKELNIPYEYFGVRQLEISRAMFFVLRDTPEDVPAEVCKIAKEIILDILKNCNKEVSRDTVFQQSFQSIVSQIVFDLSNYNIKVRETAKEAIKILSEVTSVPISSMITPSKGILLAPIFGKPLRALPFHMQIGNIDAITFCLGLDDTFLEFNDELNRLLSEALALVDADDESLINVNSISEHSTSEQLINLRIVCIELLSLALTKKEFSNGQVRIRILSVFFKTLCSKSSRIINAAHAGLKRVLSQNSKLPKELLQSGLRPMLMNLSDYKKLTVSGLEALSRLLELLISYFKVEIGRKLLDHLMAWAQPPVLQRISLQELDNSLTVQIIVAIFKIFHLLPPQAYTFLKELMETLLFLETSLRHHYSSPFRDPLASFLNRFADHSIAFMKEHIASRNYGSRFAYFLAIEKCGDLREEFKKTFGSFIEKLTNESNNDVKYVILVNIVDAVESLALHDKEWFACSGEILKSLGSITVDCLNYEKTSPISSSIHFQLDQSIQKLQNIYVKYLKLDETSFKTTIDFVNYLCVNEIIVSKDLEDFLLNDIIKINDPEKAAVYMNELIEFITDSTYELVSKIYLLHHVAIPLCYYYATSKKTAAITNLSGKPAVWLQAIGEKIWAAGPETPKLESFIFDKFRVELLQLTSLLLEYYSDAVVEWKKAIIKFNWNFITLEDNISKQAAYISTVHFIRAFDTPAKVIIQVFVALLKANQTDVKFMVRQSLDLLAPYLNEKLGSDREWINWTRRVLSEDGFTVTQVSNIYQFIVNYSELFYSSRDQFIPNMITAMGKLTVVNNAATENQMLAIDLAELLLRWEIKSKKAAEVKEIQTGVEVNRIDVDVMDVDTENTDKNEDGKNNNDDAMEIEERVSIEKPSPLGHIMYSVPISQRDTCITFLIRYVCICSQRASENELGRRALNILHILLSPNFWPDVSIKLSFFEKFLVNTDSNVSNMLVYCLNALEVLNITLEWKTSDGIMQNLPEFQQLLEKCIKSNNHDIQEALQSVLLLILQAISLENTGEDSAEEVQETEGLKFLKFLVSVIAEDLTIMSSVAAGVTLLSSVAKFNPELLDPHIPLIVRTLGKLIKDHVTLLGQGKHQPAADNSNSTEYEAKMTTKLVEKLLNFGADRIVSLGDQRRIYLSVLVQLIDKSSDKGLLTTIAHIVRNWLFNANGVAPTVKEKAGVLSKMMIYELKGDSELTKTYYEIIMDIFKDENINYGELTFRLEHPFLVGTKISDVSIRQELMSILNRSLEKDIRSRLFYIIREQNWEYLSEYPWLNQASQILYDSFDFDYPLKLSNTENTLAPMDEIDVVLPNTKSETPADGVINLLKKHKKFIDESLKTTASDILAPLLDISYQSPEAIHNSWCTLFPIVYNAIEQKEKSDFLYAFVTLLSKDYHMRQQEGKPNVINTMLTAAGKCPDLQLPPHLVKYLGINYDVWYSGVRILEQIELNPIIDNSKIKETNRDALVEMYSNLQEDDMFYGLWRRRSKYFETNAALSYEQVGLWDKAMKLYETAQVKARSSILPYSESEYALWEDNWILCAEKLQCWDILTELAKHEGFTDLLLECGWRVADWITDKEPLEQSTKTVMDVPTPRRQMFQAFLCLQGYAHNTETIQNVTRQVDEGIQLSLRKWYTLPQRLTSAHVSLLHSFQQYVEFMEATQVYRSLTSTTAENLDVKSQDLKRVLQAWRERLPNVWDDINIWNDLVTWRKHAFEVINKVYIPLIPAIQQTNNNNNSYAFRGYHEIAWVINRFAHVARKHNMPDVCINQLTKIYTLPNIEIQEAFLKLREQAKCHYQNPAELSTGLDVISNTNLVYFAAQQKAEFITLKGMFLAKLNVPDEANQAFATAVQLDLNLPKAWAEWGFFNDNRFKETNDINYAKHAISCYLQAASLYKNNKARRLLCRILWLISLDDNTGTLTESFESHQGDMPVWHWVTFIPQLLSALSHREASFARKVLIRIAKSYPQALHFQLRTSKEDYAVLQRQQVTTAAAESTNLGGQPNTTSATGETNVSGGASFVSNNIGSSTNPSATPAGSPPTISGSPSIGSGNILPQSKPWVHVDEIMGILKTAYPLLALSLESLVDQISQRFKSNHDGDAYRLVVALYNDGVQYFNRLCNPKEDARLPPATEANIVRFANTVLPAHIKEEFEIDLIQSKPNLETYISKLKKWKDCLEEKLDRTYGKVNLERVCPHLSQFHHQKFEDIEIPGQYLLNKETNQYFIKIERFMSTIEMIRGPTACYKRITIRGHDGSLHKFAVQFPAARHCRREERIFQLFRLFNDQLSRNVQTRRRHIEFTLPIAIPLSPHIRLMSDDDKYVNMLNIYERYCKVKGQNRDEPLAYTIEKLHAAYDPRLPRPDVLSVKTEILSAIQSLFVPNTVMKNYFLNYYPKFEDFWVFRKQFSSQYATFALSTYMLCINARQPQKIHIHQGSGRVWTSEMLPYKVVGAKTPHNIFQNSSLDVSAQRAAPMFCSLELVPFRLTPNIQELIGPIGSEGILSMHMMLIAQCLADPQYEIEHFLNLFIRDEIQSWYAQRMRSGNQETPNLREIVKVNVDYIVKRLQQLANSDTYGQSVSSQYIVNLITHAVNPRNLASTDTLWMAYL